MTFPESSPEIDVEPVAAPVDAPWPADAEPPVAGEAAGPLSLDAVTERLVGIVQAPFAGVALVRGPHWAVSDDEARPIARNLAAVLPRTWWLERALNVTPWGLAGAHLVVLVRSRLEADRQLAAAAAVKEEPDAEPTPAPPGDDTRPDRPAAVATRRARRPAVRADGEPPGRAGGVDSGDFEGAGNGPAV